MFLQNLFMREKWEVSREKYKFESMIDRESFVLINLFLFSMSIRLKVNARILMKPTLIDVSEVNCQSSVNQANNEQHKNVTENCLNVCVFVWLSRFLPPLSRSLLFSWKFFRKKQFSFKEIFGHCSRQLTTSVKLIHYSFIFPWLTYVISANIWW